jgi:hypothetical protein
MFGWIRRWWGLPEKVVDCRVATADNDRRVAHIEGQLGIVPFIYGQSEPVYSSKARRLEDAADFAKSLDKRLSIVETAIKVLNSRLEKVEPKNSLAITREEIERMVARRIKPTPAPKKPTRRKVKGKR